MAVIQVNGNYFLTATEGPVNRLTLEFLGIDDQHYFNPSGPNAGEDPPGATVNTWTDTVIEISDTNIVGEELTGVSVIDENAGFIVPFDVSPDQLITPAPVGQLVLASIQPETGQWTFIGTDLLTAGGLRVYYDAGSSFSDYTPSTPGIFWGSSVIQFTDAAVIGEIVSSVEIYTTAPNIGLLDTLSGDGPIIVGPSAVSITADSPANDQVRVQGLYFDDVDRLIVTMTPLATYDFYDPLGPNVGLNPIGATIIAWTDTEITIEYAPLSGQTVDEVNLLEVSGGFNVPADVTDFVVL